MSDRSPYSVPKEPGRWRALVLAALVHLALLAFLWIGVRWQNETPATIEAEVWSPQPREAAPQPQPESEPVKQPQPAPEPPKPAPPEPPRTVAKETPVAKPDIALEQEKKRKEEARKQREEEERQAAIRKQKELKAEEEKLAKRKEEERKEQLEKEKLAKLKQEQEKKRQEEDKRKEQEKTKKAAEAKRKQREADEKLMAKMREEDMKRITGAVSGTGGSGDAPKSQGGRADAGYAGRVAAKIKSNIVFNVPEGLTSNPPVEYVVDLLPDGSIASIRKTKSSGIPGFDEAVYNAIRKSEPYPKDKSGSVPSSFIGIHRPKDQ